MSNNVKFERILGNLISRNYLSTWNKNLDILHEKLQISPKNLSYLVSRIFLQYHCLKSVRIRSYSGLYLSVFGLKTERYFVSLRIQYKCKKIRTRIAPNTDTFHTVYFILERRKLKILVSISYYVKLWTTTYSIASNKKLTILSNTFKALKWNQVWVWKQLFRNLRFPEMNPLEFFFKTAITFAWRCPERWCPEKSRIPWQHP